MKWLTSILLVLAAGGVGCGDGGDGVELCSVAPEYGESTGAAAGVRVRVDPAMRSQLVIALDFALDDLASESAEADRLILEFWERDQTEEPSQTVGPSSWFDCFVCPLLQGDPDEDGRPTQLFLALSGEIEVTEFTVPESADETGRIAGEIVQARMAHVDTGGAFGPALVDDGCEANIEGLGFDVEFTRP